MYLEKLLSGYREGQKNGHLFIVSGPSGAGKTVLCKKAIESFPNLIFSISYTTRTQRPQEIEGRDYFFLTQEEFKAKITRNEFLEWAQVHGNYYGTCRGWITAKLAKGFDIILDIDVQGADQIRQKQMPGCSIFVIPPSMEILKQRLIERASDAVEDITQRLHNAEEEIRCANNYQYLIVNDKLPEAVELLASIVRSQKSLLAEISGNR